jgi:p-cumate 2,3-dioxygenase beta subunit
MMQEMITRADVEEFLVDEAALLDNWQLDAWLALMAQDAHYLVPALDKPQADYRKSLFLISDDMKTLRSRVTQLKGRTVWAENPKSRTRRLVSNFRVLGEENGMTRITANFAVWRFQLDQTETYVGRYEHLVARAADGNLRFHERKAVLDHETLRPHGKLSFIL